MLLVFILF